MSKGLGGLGASLELWASDGSASGRVDLDDPGRVDATDGETYRTGTIKTSPDPAAGPPSDPKERATEWRQQARNAVIHRLMARKRQQRRRSLKETGDYLGVQGVNPLTGQPDIITPSSSDERDEMAEDIRHGNPPIPRTFKQNMHPNAGNLVGEVGGDSDRNLSSKVQSNTGKAINLSQKRREPSQWSSVQEPNLSPIIQSLNSDSDKTSAAVKAMMTEDIEDNPLICFTPPPGGSTLRDRPLPRTPTAPTSPTRVSSCETVIRARRPQTTSPSDFWAQELYDNGIKLSHGLTPSRSSHVHGQNDQARHDLGPRDDESYPAHHITFTDQSLSMKTPPAINDTPPSRAAQSIPPDTVTSVFRQSELAPDPGGTTATRAVVDNAEEATVTPQPVSQEHLGNHKQHVSLVQPPVTSPSLLNNGMPDSAFTKGLGLGITSESAKTSGKNAQPSVQKQTEASAQMDGLDAAILLPGTLLRRVSEEPTSVWAGCPVGGMKTENARRIWTPTGMHAQEKKMYRSQKKGTSSTVAEPGDFYTQHPSTDQQEVADEQCVYTPIITTTGSAREILTWKERDQLDSPVEDDGNQRRGKWLYNQPNQTPPVRDYQASGPSSASQNWRGSQTGTPQIGIRSAPGTVNRAVDEKGRPGWWAPDKTPSHIYTSTSTHLQRETREESLPPGIESDKSNKVPQPEVDSPEEEARQHSHDTDVAGAYFPDELDDGESDEDITSVKMLLCCLWYLVVGILGWYARQVRPCWDPRSGFWGRVHRGEASWRDLYVLALFMTGASYLLEALAKGWELAEMLRELISIEEEY